MGSFQSGKTRFISVMAVTLALAACASSQPAPTPAAETKPVAQPTPPPPAPAPAPVETPPPPLAQPEPVSVYFAFDSSEISGDARSVLMKGAGQAQTRRDLDLRIEGNCDERGTTEYNLALGQRRADAAKNYLVNLGVDGSRITTVSNGKEKPRAPGHDEQSWAENRRADVIPTTRAVGQR
ncbi:MAG TPA: OmpA family protein [Myxococcales bacterium]|nr:OmpA family protein [Myxococcales bacterium]